MAAMVASSSAQSDLVAVKEGNLPIIITAPHGGREPVPGVDIRTGKEIERRTGGKRNFSTVLDTDSDKFAVALADEIEKRLGGRPYLVVARFSRKYIDANRPASDAYEMPGAKPVYEAYHGAIEKARREIVRRWGTGILLDIHGQGSRKDVAFRGTVNLQTVKHLLAKHGMGALTGAQGLLGVFAARGNTVFPTNEATEQKEHTSYDGGWTVRRYGSMGGGTFDAVQLELGITFRREGRDKAAADLAEAVAVFARKYLPRQARGGTERSRPSR